ncbi:trace amine-associated receptor 4-like [Latimeria chalumnae]|uniref:trace amine-associated receptor 4-like n=1 Tax=Latimeria chalumnae TaxID=7897 RepID=UPI00313AB68D
MNATSVWGLDEVQYCFEFINSSCPKSLRSRSIYMVMYIFMSGAIIITMIGNLLVIISISHFKQLQSPTNFFLLSLAIADFLLGFGIMPYSMIRSIESCWYFGESLCKIHSGCDMMLCTASIFHLCFIAVDRYCAVCDPLHYSVRITIPVVMLFLVISWLVPICFAFGVMFTDSNAEGIEDFVDSVSCTGFCVIILNKLWGVLAPVVAFFSPAVIMIGIYTKIFFVARRHAVVINNTIDKVNFVKDIKNKISKNKETKAAKTLSIVMGVFLLCWLPFMVISVVDPFLNFSAPAVLYDSLMWLGYFNSMLNPIIYGFFYPWFRKALKTLLTGEIFTQNSSVINLFPDLL